MIDSMEEKNLKNYGHEMQEFLIRFVTTEFQNEKPNSLYHYTDSKGLHGILSNSTIWLTSFKFMNDSRELKHGLKTLKEIFIQRLSEQKYDSSFKKLCDVIFDYIEKDCDSPKATPYVFSLSKKRDHLSQWRGYGDFGRGFSIKFDVENLSLLRKNQIFLCQVHYDPSLVETLMVEMIDEWFKLAHKIADENANFIENNHAQDLALLFIQTAYALSITVKHPGFEEEEEWRLITFLDNGNRDLKYRAHRFGVADYTEVPFDSLKFITEIMSGPIGPDLSYLKSSISSLLNSSIAIAFEKSEIPFV